MLVLLKLKKIGAILVIFMFNWIALSAFLFPLTTANGLQSVSEAPTNITNLIYVISLSTFLTFAWVSGLSKIIGAAMATFILVAVVPTLPNMLSGFRKSQEIVAIELSDKLNVFVIGFDGVPGHAVKEVLEAEPNLKHRFKDFVFFENVASSAPITTVSQAGIIHGNHDFTKWDEPDIFDVSDLYFNNSDEFDLYTGYTYNVYNKTGATFAATDFGLSFQLQQMWFLYKNIALRLMTKTGVVLLESLEENLIHPDRKIYTRSTYYFDYIVGLMRGGNDKISVMYFHFGLTHYPVGIHENCTVQVENPEWLYSHQNETGIVKSSHCVLKKYAELIDVLKEIGVYDNSLIIFNSDHGKPSKYYKSSPNRLRINENPISGFGRYQPMLMIKQPLVQRDEMEINSNIVLLDDIAKTICYVVEFGKACDQRPGLDLLSKNDVAPDNFYIHVPRDDEPAPKLETLKAVKISRKIPLLEAMQESPEIELSEPLQPKPQN
jgi:hypothetical protein